MSLVLFSCVKATDEERGKKKESTEVKSFQLESVRVCGFYDNTKPNLIITSQDSMLKVSVLSSDTKITNQILTLKSKTLSQEFGCAYGDAVPFESSMVLDPATNTTETQQVLVAKQLETCSQYLDEPGQPQYCPSYSVTNFRICGVLYRINISFPNPEPVDTKFRLGTQTYYVTPTNPMSDAAFKLKNLTLSDSYMACIYSFSLPNSTSNGTFLYADAITLMGIQ